MPNGLFGNCGLFATCNGVPFGAVVGATHGEREPIKPVREVCELVVGVVAGLDVVGSVMQQCFGPAHQRRDSLFVSHVSPVAPDFDGIRAGAPTIARASSSHSAQVSHSHGSSPLALTTSRPQSDRTVTSAGYSCPEPDGNGSVLACRCPAAGTHVNGCGIEHHLQDRFRNHYLSPETDPAIPRSGSSPGLKLHLSFGACPETSSTTHRKLAYLERSFVNCAENQDSQFDSSRAKSGWAMPLSLAMRQAFARPHAICWHESLPCSALPVIAMKN